MCDSSDVNKYERMMSLGRVVSCVILSDVNKYEKEAYESSYTTYLLLVKQSRLGERFDFSHENQGIESDKRYGSHLM